MIYNTIDSNILDNWINNKIGYKLGLLSRQAIESYQLRRVQDTIDYISRCSPFYKKHFQGIADRRLTCLEDLAQLPYTTAEDICSNYAKMLCVSQDDVERVVTLETSGTTGVPKRLYFTNADQEITIDFFMQGMSTFTALGQRVIIFLPGERPGSIGDLLFTALIRLGAVPIKHGIIKNLPEALEKVIAVRAEILVGIPIQLLALARYCELTKQKEPIYLKRMLLSTDYVSWAVIQEMQRIWGCEVFRYYGMTEMGLGGGLECGNHDGYHLYEGDFLFEIIDPNTGELLQEGQYGEVVFTSLTRRGMPLIRYRTGDISRFIPGSCQCGSILRRLDNIKHRKTGVIRLDVDCHLSISELDEVLLAIPGIVDFTAVISFLPERSTLNIHIKTLGKTLEPEVIHNKLDGIKALNLSQARGKLELVLEFLSFSKEYIPSVGKRKIIVDDSHTNIE